MRRWWIWVVAAVVVLGVAAAVLVPQWVQGSREDRYLELVAGAETVNGREAMLATMRAECERVDAGMGRGERLAEARAAYDPDVSNRTLDGYLEFVEVTFEAAQEVCG